MTEHIITKIANLEINDSKDSNDSNDSNDVEATTNPITECLTDDVDVHPSHIDEESDDINSLKVSGSTDEYCQALWLTGC